MYDQNHWKINNTGKICWYNQHECDRKMEKLIGKTHLNGVIPLLLNINILLILERPPWPLACSIVGGGIPTQNSGYKSTILCTSKFRFLLLCPSQPFSQTVVYLGWLLIRPPPHSIPYVGALGPMGLYGPITTLWNGDADQLKFPADQLKLHGCV